jgi:hypothetical protein
LATFKTRKFEDLGGRVKVLVSTSTLEPFKRYNRIFTLAALCPLFSALTKKVLDSPGVPKSPMAFSTGPVEYLIIDKSYQPPLSDNACYVRVYERDGLLYVNTEKQVL